MKQNNTQQQMTCKCLLRENSQVLGGGTPHVNG
jgi:hypothetical protein